MRCQACGGFLSYEPEFFNTPARYKCLVCGWMVNDPSFRKEEQRFFPADSVDRKIDWQQQHPGFDLYDPRSAAWQLRIGLSFFNYSVRTDSSAPVIMGEG